MSQNQGDENEYMEEDHEMANFYDDVDEEFQGRGMGGMESDDDDDHMVCIFFFLHSNMTLFSK